MASRTLSRAARSQLARQFSAPIAKRTFVSAVKAATRPAVARAAAPVQQFRGVKTVDFAGDKEIVYERSDWPREKLLVSQQTMGRGTSKHPRPTDFPGKGPWTYNS